MALPLPAGGVFQQASLLPLTGEERARVGVRDRDRHFTQTSERVSSFRAAHQNAAVESEKLFRSSTLSKAICALDNTLHGPSSFLLTPQR